MGQYNEVFRLGTWKDNDNGFKPGAVNNTTTTSPSNTTASLLTALPVELQLEVLSYLDVSAFVAIRRTCALYRTLVTPTYVARALTVAGGPWPNEPHVYDLNLDRVCTVCLCRPTAGPDLEEDNEHASDNYRGGVTVVPHRRALDALILDPTRPRQTWRTLCHRCWRLGLHAEGSSSQPTAEAASYLTNSPYSPSPPSSSLNPYLALASGRPALPCGLCGWPVTYRDTGRYKKLQSETTDPDNLSFTSPQFHARGGRGKKTKRRGKGIWGSWGSNSSCVWRKRLVTTTWVLLGILQACVGMVTGVIAWGVYPGIMGVVVPVSINFGLAWVSLILVGFTAARSTPPSSLTKTFCLLLIPEAVAVAVWIPAVVSTGVLKLYPEELERDSFPIFAEAMFLFNMLLRILNTAGYAILISGYDPRSPYLPDLTWWKKTGYFVLTLLTWWSFPSW